MPAMKLHFEPDLDYQRRAIDAVVDLFRGQEVGRTEFTVAADRTDAQRYLTGFGDGAGLGVGNRLGLSAAAVLENLNRVQRRGGIPESDKLKSFDFTVEMETGTGKTYVYLRTAYELNRTYGFTKFVIVVPSVAIREGVLKTLAVTKEHFRGLYAGTPAESFQYDSKRLGDVRNFATASGLEFMVVTVGAINKAERNNFYKSAESLGGARPVDLVAGTRPVLIVDEPQSVDGGLKGAGKQALGAMNPLCTLRYSATHVDKHHMVYRLDAVDAYERELVKQIEVASATVEGHHNRPFVRFLGSKNVGGAITARVELHAAGAHGPRSKEVTVRHGDDLAETTGRDVYEGVSVGEIRVGDKESIKLLFPGDEAWLLPGDTHGDVGKGGLHRALIRRTIEEHLDKELRLRPRGIKVLSLFFVPSVDGYRAYDDDGRPMKGPLAEIFESEYRRAMKLPEYRTLFEGADLATRAEEVHDGYFSIDKKGRSVDTSERRAPDRENAGRAYELIMRDKERLLSLDEPLKFLFSHSALKEGWDNPNVFQICTLREMGAERQRRQTIGRGLRLCVDATGRRVRGFETNTLTVIATEGYRAFAAALQTEVEEATGVRFGTVESTSFAALRADGDDPAADDDDPRVIGVAASRAVYEYLRAADLLGPRDRVTDALRVQIAADAVDLPAVAEPHRGAVTARLKRLSGGLEVRDRDERTPIRVRRAVLDSPEFRALWERVSRKTTYRVDFDADILAAACADALAAELADRPVPRTRVRWEKADVTVDRGGVGAAEKAGASTEALRDEGVPLPDLLGDLERRTDLTRRTLAKIVSASGTLGEFRINPQHYLRVAGEVVNVRKRAALVDGVAYRPLEDHYRQTLFESEELTGYLRNLVSAERSVHEHVKVDFGGERKFAEALESDKSVRVYAKLPDWFVVPTPLGGYNPDWAVLIETGDRDRLYFVAETKPGGALFDDARRGTETQKIQCGRAHFGAIAAGVENPARFVTVGAAEELLRRAAG